MLNQLREKLQNLLSKNSNKINLISQELQNIEINDEDEKSLENTFLILSSSLCLLLCTISYYNYLKNYELFQKNFTIKQEIAAYDQEILTIEELKIRINNLNKLKDIRFNTLKISKFFDLLANIIEFSKNDNIVNISYKLDKNLINFEVIVNSTSATFEKDFRNFVTSKYSLKKFDKTSQVQTSDLVTTQYKFEGTYESNK